MTMSREEVFEKAKLYLQSNYADARDITMPYCSLNNGTLYKDGYFKVQLNYRRTTDTPRSAIFQVNAESGAIELFKENYNWTYWS
jgi:hypothetical protein